MRPGSTATPGCRRGRHRRRSATHRHRRSQFLLQLPDKRPLFGLSGITLPPGSSQRPASSLGPVRAPRALSASRTIAPATTTSTSCAAQRRCRAATGPRTAPGAGATGSVRQAPPAPRMSTVTQVPAAVRVVNSVMRRTTSGPASRSEPRANLSASVAVRPAGSATALAAGAAVGLPANTDQVTGAQRRPRVPARAVRPPRPGPPAPLGGPGPDVGAAHARARRPAGHRSSGRHAAGSRWSAQATAQRARPYDAVRDRFRSLTGHDGGPGRIEPQPHAVADGRRPSAAAIACTAPTPSTRTVSSRPSGAGDTRSPGGQRTARVQHQRRRPQTQPLPGPSASAEPNAAAPARPARPQ